MRRNDFKMVLFASLIAAMILPFSMMDASATSNENINEKAKKKAPDMTDYVSQYRDVDKKIHDNKN